MYYVILMLIEHKKIVHSFPLPPNGIFQVVMHWKFCKEIIIVKGEQTLTLSRDIFTKIKLILQYYSHNLNVDY